MFDNIPPGVLAFVAALNIFVGVNNLIEAGNPYLISANFAIAAFFGITSILVALRAAQRKVDTEKG